MLTDSDKELILKWAGYRHYIPDDPQTYWIAPNSKDYEAIFEPDLNSLDVLIKIVDAKTWRFEVQKNITSKWYVNLKSISKDGYPGKWVDDESDNLVEALQNCLLKLAQSEAVND